MGHLSEIADKKIYHKNNFLIDESDGPATPWSPMLIRLQYCSEDKTPRPRAVP
jgi:hypothetical protein